MHKSFFIFFCLFNYEIKTEANTEMIEITKGQLRPIKLNICTTSQSNLKDKISHTLIATQRFHLTSQKESDFIIQIEVSKEDNNISINIIDTKLNKKIKTIQTSNAKQSIQKICNIIYESITHEEGIFSNQLLFTVFTGKNTCDLYSINLDQTDFKKLNKEKLYNISDIFLCDNKIFIVKFLKKHSGFGILYFNTKNKKFYNIFNINHAAVHSPIIYEKDIFIAVTHQGTTGIYKKPFTGTASYQSYESFMQDPYVTTVIKIPSKIATAPSISKGKIAYCADFNGRPSIYIYPNRQISSKDATYFDPALNSKYLAVIKTKNGKFHLALINIKNGIEKTLLTKYYIGKPVWSPCGNWIAVSCRDQHNQDQIYIIHKSGQYHMILRTNHKIKHIIWMQSMKNEEF